MALPTSYLTSVKNLSGILNSIVGAQAPDKFTTRFLESLEYKSTSDRLVIGLLKSLGFLADDGRPTQRYFSYLDQSQSAIVLGQAIEEAYADLFRVNKTAHKMSKQEVVNKFKTLSQGQYSESVLDKMAMTFTALCGLADFETKPANQAGGSESDEMQGASTEQTDNSPPLKPTGGRLGVSSLVYNIQLILPESRDPKVYDALFESLQKHLT